MVHKSIKGFALSSSVFDFFFSLSDSFFLFLSSFQVTVLSFLVPSVYPRDLSFGSHSTRGCCHQVQVCCRVEQDWCCTTSSYLVLVSPSTCLPTPWNPLFIIIIFTALECPSRVPALWITPLPISAHHPLTQPVGNSPHTNPSCPSPSLWLACCLCLPPSAAALLCWLGQLDCHLRRCHYTTHENPVSGITIPLLLLAQAVRTWTLLISSALRQALSIFNF